MFYTFVYTQEAFAAFRMGAGDRPLPRILAARHEDLSPLDLEMAIST